MSTTTARQLPKAQESLADYVNRQRAALGLTRIALAERAGIHKQSLGKIECGQTQTLNRRTWGSASDAVTKCNNAYVVLRLIIGPWRINRRFFYEEAI